MPCTCAAESTSAPIERAAFRTCTRVTTTPRRASRELLAKKIGFARARERARGPVGAIVGPGERNSGLDEMAPEMSLHGMQTEYTRSYAATASAAFRNCALRKRVNLKAANCARTRYGKSIFILRTRHNSMKIRVEKVKLT